MRFFYAIKTALLKMPTGLRLATGLSLIFTLFIPGAVMPFGQQSIDGVDVSLAEFWRRGGGPMFLCIGGISTLFAYGFIQARRWIRPVVVACGWWLVIGSVIEDRHLSSDVISTIVFCGCLPIWYLYFRRPVRAYFGVTDEKRVA